MPKLLRGLRCLQPSNFLRYFTICFLIRALPKTSQSSQWLPQPFSCPPTFEQVLDYLHWTPIPCQTIIPSRHLPPNSKVPMCLKMASKVRIWSVLSFSSSSIDRLTSLQRFSRNWTLKISKLGPARRLTALYCHFFVQSSPRKSPIRDSTRIPDASVGLQAAPRALGCKVDILCLDHYHR